jgi:hypothetical protein
MKIVGREETWIHTHFLTDCTRLSGERMKEVTQTMTSFLREIGVVYGVHFTQLRDERTCRIVLECIPFPHTLDRIQQKLQATVREIPSRPPTTTVKAEKPTENTRPMLAR